MTKGLNYVIAGSELISLKIDKSSAGKEKLPQPFQGESDRSLPPCCISACLHTQMIFWFDLKKKKEKKLQIYANMEAPEFSF